MMALVWLIDVLVIGVKILGGRIEVNPVLRYGLWFAVLCAVGAGVALAGALLLSLQHYLENLP
ncbi:hypothetical protein [Nocardia spumae]|uniref:hypothetical protein n=1 Tax=Nocardia spumae TaxID=2887190 RepID=UPI001D146ABD|nr:hypothetical protein [Nocardia spumae]